MDKKQEALIKAKRYIRRPAKLYKRYKTKVKEILNGGDAIWLVTVVTNKMEIKRTMYATITFKVKSKEEFEELKAVSQLPDEEWELIGWNLF